MFTEQIVVLLIQERDRLNLAIEALQGPAKQRGRPPKNLAAISTLTPDAPKRKAFSAATRRRMALAQKKRWATLKAAK